MKITKLTHEFCMRICQDYPQLEHLNLSNNGNSSHLITHSVLVELTTISEHIGLLANLAHL